MNDSWMIIFIGIVFEVGGCGLVIKFILFVLDCVKIEDIGVCVLMIYKLRVS